jgi:hypothetical protein
VKKFLVLAVLACASLPAMVRGEVIVSVENKDVNYSLSDQTGSLYIYLHSTENPQPMLKSFDLLFTLSGASGVTLLDAQKPPGTGTRDYLLPSGYEHKVTQVSPAQFKVSDLVLNLGNDIVEGRAFVQVDYKIAGGTSIGSHGNITIDTGYTDLFIVDPNNQQGQYGTGFLPLPYTALNGTITVVPEPGTLVLLCTGGLAVAMLALRRRVRSKG